MRIGHISTVFYIWIWGKLVGTDGFGNRYFYRPVRKTKGTKRDKTKREKRWVLYANEAEASRVPPEWHSWLHHSVADPPTEQAKQPAAGQADFDWIKPHSPNRTGTSKAFLPPGHPLKGGHRPPATGDYQAWRPR